MDESISPLLNTPNLSWLIFMLDFYQQWCQIVHRSQIKKLKLIKFFETYIFFTAFLSRVLHVAREFPDVLRE